jgi:hypothetical protein
MFRIGEGAKHKTSKKWVQVDREGVLFAKYLMVSYVAYSLTLKMEAVYSSRTSGLFQTTPHYSVEVCIFIAGLRGSCENC